MERSAFTNPRVQEAFAPYVVVQLHCDHDDKAIQERNLALEARLGDSNAQPLYVVVDPRAEAVLGKWGYESAAATTAEFWIARLADAARRLR